MKMTDKELTPEYYAELALRNTCSSDRVTAFPIKENIIGAISKAMTRVRGDEREVATQVTIQSMMAVIETAPFLGLESPFVIMEPETLKPIQLSWNNDAVKRLLSLIKDTVLKHHRNFHTLRDEDLARENEACAKIAEEYVHHDGDHMNEVARLIRDRLK